MTTRTGPIVIRNDCLHFRGDKPCRFARVCEGCADYAPLEGRTRVLVIKCRAQGDVLRTTALLPAIRRRYPDCQITWVVDPESMDLLAGNPLVDRIMLYDAETVPALAPQRFHVLLSLDKEPGLTGLAEAVRADRKLGFGMNAFGNLAIFSPAAAYAFRLGIDDDLKYRRNTKTYQEIAAEAVELDYRGDEYVFSPPAGFDARADGFVRTRGLGADAPVVGLNTGAGSKFTTKQWPAEHYAGLIERLLEAKLTVFLLGGRREQALNRGLERRFSGRVHDTGPDNSIPEFAGFIDRCACVVTSDTLGMHIAIALRKPVVALFGPTCPQEIDLYGRGVKLFTGEDCAPCYRQACPDARCMAGITPAAVFAEVRRLL